MNCEIYQRKLADAVVGRLDDLWQQSVDRHLGECAECSRFAAEIRDLYLVDDPTLTEMPIPTRSLVRSPWLSAAAVLLVAATIFVAWPRDRGAEESGATEEQATTVALASPLEFNGGEFELPDFPREYPGGLEFSNRRAAETAASFAGMPLLEEYSLPICPLCSAHAERLETPEGKELLAGFVLYRERMSQSPPPWIVEESAREDVYGFGTIPALRWRQGERAGEIKTRVRSLDDVTAVIESWRQEGGVEGKPLTASEFQRVIEHLDQVPDVLSEGEYERAVELLSEASKIAEGAGSAFVELIEALRRDLDAFFLASELSRIERLVRGTARERRQAEDLVERLQRLCIDTETTERLHAAVGRQ